MTYSAQAVQRITAIGVSIKNKIPKPATMPQSVNFLLRWGILGATFLFLGITLVKNWHQVSQLQLQQQAWLYGGIALTVAVMAQLWAAFMWGWILEALKHPVPKRWTMVVFLKNSPAKYIPGNVWHFYGRVMAAKKLGIAVDLATLSVILEPLFVIAGALGLALLNPAHLGLQGLILGMVLLAVHPRVLNLLWRFFRQLRGKPDHAVCMQHYPLRVLIGATAFMGLRGIAFFWVVLVFTPLTWDAVRPLLGGFSFAWLISLVAPAPAGLGVFEASAIAVLDSFLAPGLLLGAVAVYRLLVVTAEIIGAGLAYLVNEGLET